MQPVKVRNAKFALGIDEDVISNQGSAFDKINETQRIGT